MNTTPRSKPSETICNDQTTFKEAPILILKGMLMGSADVVPGVSGGTMALITGVYTRLLDAVRSVDSTAIRSLLKFRITAFMEQVHWKFLAFLLMGMISAVLFFTRVIPLPLLIFTHPEPIYGLFFGLIVGSVFILMAVVRPLNLQKVLLLIAGITFGAWLVLLVPTNTPESLWFIFLSGALAITAMVLPGISGSFILLILGKYAYIFGQFARLGGPDTMDALIILGVFGLGILVGIAAFSRFLSWLLHRYFDVTMCVLIGFLIGSMVAIWPWQERTYETTQQTIAIETSDSRLQSALPQGSSPHLPEFYMLPDLGSSPDHLIRIQKKATSTSPIWPGSDNNMIWPVLCMLAGLSLVLGVEFIAKNTTRNTDKRS